MASTTRPRLDGDAAARLVDGPITRTLLVYSVPLLTTQLLHTLAGTWSAVWVSHVLGPNALTAVVNINVFVFMMMGAVMGVGAAASMIIAQARGAGEPEVVRRVVGTAMAFVIAISALLAAAGLVFAGDILALMRMPAEARGLALTHLRMTCISLPGIFTMIFMTTLLRGNGDARTPFLFTLLWIGIGLAIAPLLLTGSLGLPRLGIESIGIGGIIAAGIALCGMLVHLYRIDHPIALRGRDLRFLRPDPALLTMLITRGAPMAAEAFIVQGAYFVLLVLVNGHGAATAAAYSAASQLWAYVQMPSFAVGGSMSVMAAMNIGAGRWDRIDAIALKGTLLSILCALLLTLAIYAAGDAALRLFLPAGGPALGIARQVSLITLWGWVLLSITTSLSAVVRSNGAMAAPTIIYAVTMWGIRVPFAMLLAPLLGATAIWWSFPLGAVMSAVLALGYYRWGGWRTRAPMWRDAAASSQPPDQSAA